MYVFYTSGTASPPEDSIFFEDEADVKPTVLPPLGEEEQEEDVKLTLDSLQSSSSPPSETTTGKGK